MQRTVGTLMIECVKGDITAQDGFDAVVNAANAQLLPGGGVAGAIHRAAGPGLAEECRPLAPIEPGQAVITGGYGLPNPFVIHCLGPVYGVDEPSALLLADCYRNALRLADEHRLESVAFPAISTGFLGIPGRGRPSGYRRGRGDRLHAGVCADRTVRVARRWGVGRLPRGTCGPGILGAGIRPQADARR